jgi:hypothetical protein
MANTQTTVMINVRATPEWRKYAHKQARKRGLTLSDYLRQLVEQDTAA